MGNVLLLGSVSEVVEVVDMVATFALETAPGCGGSCLAVPSPFLLRELCCLLAPEELLKALHAETKRKQMPNQEAWPN